jgi:tryptophan-rich sensory protein
MPIRHLISNMTRQGHWLMYLAMLIAGGLIWIVVFLQQRDQGRGWVAILLTVFVVLAVVYAR